MNLFVIHRIRNHSVGRACWDNSFVFVISAIAFGCSIFILWRLQKLAFDETNSHPVIRLSRSYIQVILWSFLVVSCAFLSNLNPLFDALPFQYALRNCMFCSVTSFLMIFSGFRAFMTCSASGIPKATAFSVWTEIFQWSFAPFHSRKPKYGFIHFLNNHSWLTNCPVLYLQDEKNQIMTTNVWLQQVRHRLSPFGHEFLAHVTIGRVRL